MKREYAQNHDPVWDWIWLVLIVQDGRTDLGIRTVRELEAKVPADRREEYLGLMTKLLAEAAEYEKAISTAAKWEESLEKKDPPGYGCRRGGKRQRPDPTVTYDPDAVLSAYGYVQPENSPKPLRKRKKPRPEHRRISVC